MYSADTVFLVKYVYIYHYLNKYCYSLCIQLISQYFIRKPYLLRADKMHVRNYKVAKQTDTGKKNN